jgi:DNA-binding NarL/FixJ family response regulator
MRYDVAHYADGNFRIPNLPVTGEALMRHAERFGTESVYETAEAENLPSRDLALLRVELDSLEAGRKSSRGFTIGRRRRRTRDETRDAVLALSVQGLVPKSIADKLGIADRTVRRYLQASGATAAEMQFSGA